MSTKISAFFSKIFNIGKNKSERKEIRPPKHLKICIDVYIQDSSPVPVNVIEKLNNVDLIVTDTQAFTQKVNQFLSNVLDDSSQSVDTWKSAINPGSPYKHIE